MSPRAILPRAIGRAAHGSGLVLALLSLPALVLSTAALHAHSTIDVPATVPTIQGAIDIAAPGDTVLVAPGTYFEGIDLLGKAITVRSSDGPLVTTIDAQNSGRVVTMTSGEGPATVLEGFTIRGGQLFGIDFSVGGAGIFIENGGPTIRGNIIRDNIASWRGAGIYSLNSTPLIERNQFIANSFFAPVADIWYGLGGGLCVIGGAVELLENTFIQNSGGDTGGGVYLEGTTGSVLRTNVFRDNVNGYGGAIGIGPAVDVEIDNLLAVGNMATGRSSLIGPGTGLGGAIAILSQSSATIDGATIIGGSCLDGFTGPGEGGGIYVETPGPNSGVLRNAIVRGNIAGIDGQITAGFPVEYANVEGGFVGGSAIIDADPLFVVGPEGEFYLAQTAAGQVQTSPCVDAGAPGAPFPGTTRTDSAPDTGTTDLGWHFLIDESPFRRGDCNDDGSTNIADAITVLNALFQPPGTFPPITCADACDANDDGNRNIADAVAVLNSLFVPPSIPIPPPTGTCGEDPTGDALTCDAAGSC